MAARQNTRVDRLALTFHQAMTPIFVFALVKRGGLLDGGVGVQGDLRLFRNAARPRLPADRRCDLCVSAGSGSQGRARELRMFKVRVIPCLDVKDGRVVKGVNFVDLRDAGDPVEAAIAYDAAGADELTFLDITASHENRGTMLECRAAHGRSLLHAADGRRRRAHHRGHPRAAALGRRQGLDQHRGRAPARVRQGSGGKIRRPVRRRRHRRQAGEARRRLGPLGDFHPWRPQRHRHRCDRVCPGGGVARRRRNPADVDGPRRHPARVRHSADPRRSRTVFPYR